MNDETQLIKGILEGCILELLSREPAYGYLVVERLTEAGLETNEATVYPILTRLLKQNALRFERRPSPYGPERKYYSLTKEGERMRSRFLSSWKNITNTVDRFLGR